MKVDIGRVKDSRESWMFLVISGFVVAYVGGTFDSYGILVVVFVEYFDETNTNIGRVNLTMPHVHSLPFRVGGFN